ncbi:hypothetical protein [Aquipseudomonas campi]
MDANPSNPFQSPEAELIESTDSATLRRPVYSVAAVGVATFFGTPLGGAWVLAHNLRTLGLGNKVATAWWLGIGLLVASFILSLVLPENIPTLPFVMAQLFGMVQYAKSTLGDRVDQHKAQNGAMYSNWRAFGIALLFTLAVLVVMVPLLLVIEG